MSILIKGMEMPPNGEGNEVIVRIQPDGTVLNAQGIHLYAKAKEIPRHGRLIDADELLKEAKRLSGPMTGDGWDNWGVYALIERQPTIIEAEVMKE